MTRLAVVFGDGGITVTLGIFWCPSCRDILWRRKILIKTTRTDTFEIWKK